MLKIGSILLCCSEYRKSEIKVSQGDPHRQAVPSSQRSQDKYSHCIKRRREEAPEGGGKRKRGDKRD